MPRRLGTGLLELALEPQQQPVRMALVDDAHESPAVLDHHPFLEFRIGRGAVAGVDAYVRTSVFSRWGRKNFEAMLVGLPVLWTVQRGLGANRPSDPDPDPRWRPLADDNAASGHAFIAGIPWLNLARRLPPSAGRGIARVLSTVTGWSRLNDDKHYLSQVLLGWVIAWNATAAVEDTPSVALTAGPSTGEEPAVAEPDSRPR